MNKEELIIIDGTEGGGQILRTALALSIINRKPFKIINIRRSRSKQGLQPQHLEGIKAAIQISSGEAEGVKIGSKELIFIPKEIKYSQYKFDILTAGSISLLFHTIYLALSFAKKGSNLIMKGGTHVPWSPTYNYLKECWQWFMSKIGLKININMRRAGFFPHGGGIIEADVQPVSKINPVKILQRGKLNKIIIYSAHTNLNNKVAERQAEAAKKVLINYADYMQIKIDSLPSYSKNTTIAITAYFDNTICCYTGLGEKGKPAEKVAEETCKNFIEFLDSNATIDDYMADQILLPLAFCEQNSEFIIRTMTEHFISNIKTIKEFIEFDVNVEELSGREFKVKLRSKGKKK